jgi:hypothetical protein
MKPIARRSTQSQEELIKGGRLAANCVGLGLVIMSIVHELRLPPAERTWHGLLFGHVPYEWRPPTLGRIQEAFWQPQSPDLFRPTVFGVGWSINVASLVRLFGRNAER